MKRIFVLFGMLVCTAVVSQTGWAEEPPAEAPKTAEEPPKKDEKAAAAKNAEFQMKAWQTINGSGAQIDECTARYSREFPEAKGTVELSIELAIDGKVSKSNARSSLRASEKLATCIKNIANAWRFPSPGGAGTKTTLSIPVQKDLKFALLKPGEKAPEAKNERAPKSKLVTFMPAYRADD